MSLRLAAPKGRSDVLIIAGEHSGDQHAATMLAELKARCPELEVYAVGGPALKNAGAELLLDLTQHSVVGFIEVLKHYLFFVRLLDEVVRWIEVHKPRVVCLVDYPGFNLRLAEKLYKHGVSKKGGGSIPLCYYISPQIWAWKAGRRFKMAQFLDGLGTLFPFESDCYADTDLPVQFLGHPFIQKDYAFPFKYSAEGPILLLPGSRKVAVSKIFPVMLEAFGLYLKQHPGERALALYPNVVIKDVFSGVLNHFPDLAGHVDLKDAKTEGLCGKAVLGSSGTMSLNAALVGIPGAIMYKLSAVTYFFARFFAKVKFIGIANILLNRLVYPEYIQSQARGEALALELEDCHKNASERRAQQLKDSEDLRSALTQAESLDSGQWLESWLEKSREA